MRSINIKKSFIHYLPIYGCISTAIVYVLIGVIAILSFLKLKEGGADESSLMAFLNNYTAGKVLVWIILLGAVCYIIWRIYESIKDPYGYGNKAKGIVIRIGIALSTTADMLFAFAGIQVLLGLGDVRPDGDPVELRAMISSLLDETPGKLCVIVIGVIILLTAIVQLLYGFTNGFRERLESDHFSPLLKRTVRFLAWTGYLARGIILGIIGAFFLKAGILEDGQYVVNTDKAFDFIGTHIGHLYFILVAIGTICYGVFTFVLGLAYDVDKD